MDSWHPYIEWIGIHFEIRTAVSCVLGIVYVLPG